jgi:hypothetical protein
MPKSDTGAVCLDQLVRVRWNVQTSQEWYDWVQAEVERRQQFAVRGRIISGEVIMDALALLRQRMDERASAGEPVAKEKTAASKSKGPGRSKVARIKRKAQATRAA